MMASVPTVTSPQRAPLRADNPAHAGLQVALAGFSDVPGFLADVVAGVAEARFSADYLEFLHQVALARVLLSAVLRGRLRGDRLARPGWTLLRVSRNGTTLGCALLRRSVDARGPVIDISLMAIRPEWRHHGAATALVRHVLACAHGSARVRCACAAGAREMIALVQKLGFRRTQVARTQVGGVQPPHEFTYQRPAAVASPPR